ncbi:Uncharacterized protein QTN25_000477 [Entamoeba marina]
MFVVLVLLQFAFAVEHVGCLNNTEIINQIDLVVTSKNVCSLSFINSTVVLNGNFILKNIIDSAINVTNSNVNLISGINSELFCNDSVLQFGFNEQSPHIFLNTLFLNNTKTLNSNTTTNGVIDIYLFIDMGEGEYIQYFNSSYTLNIQYFCIYGYGSQLLYTNDMNGIQSICNKHNIINNKNQISINETTELDVVVINSSSTNLTITTNTIFEINCLNCTVFINTQYQPILTFYSVQCAPMIHINPLDFLQPIIEIYLTESFECTNTIIMDFSIPCYSFTTNITSLTLGCSNLAILSNSFNTSQPQRNYSYEGYYAYSIQNNNICPPHICALGNSIYIDSNGFFLSCTNGNIYLEDGMTAVLVLSNSFVFGDLNQVLISSNVKTVNYVGIISDDQRSDTLNVEKLFISNSSEVVIKELQIYSLETIQSTAVLTLSDSCLFKTNKLMFDTVIIKDANITSNTMIVNTLETTIESFVNVTELTLHSYILQSDCSEYIKYPLIITDSFFLIENITDWIQVDSCVLTNPSIPLLLTQQSFNYKISTDAQLLCQNTLIATNGSTTNLSCSYSGINRICVLIKSNASDSSSYDMNLSTHTTCPCSIESIYGCSIVVSNNLVTGSIRSNELIINQTTEFNVKSLFVLDQLIVNYKTTITSSLSITVSTLLINNNTTLTLNTDLNVEQILGNGILKSEKLITTTNIVGVGLEIKTAEVNGNFNPSSLILNNSNISLTSSSLFNATNSIITYVQQDNSPFLIYTSDKILFTNNVFSLVFFYVTNPSITVTNLQPETYKSGIACDVYLMVCGPTAPTYSCGCPCGFNEEINSVVQGNCLLVANNISKLRNMYGQFYNIEHDNDAEFIISSDLSITNYIPQESQTFSTTTLLNDYKLYLSIVNSTNSFINLNVETELSVNGFYLFVQSTKPLVIVSFILNTFDLIIYDETTIYNNTNGSISLLTYNTNINIPYGINTSTITITTYNFTSPLFLIGNNQTFICNQFEYIGWNEGILVETTNNDLVLINNLINAYIDEEKSYLATSEMERNLLYCSYINNQWNGSYCPCSGSYCVMNIYSTEYTGNIRNVGVLNVYTTCTFSQNVQCDILNINKSVELNNSTIQQINILTNDIQLTLYYYNISTIIGNSFTLSVINSGIFNTINGSVINLILYQTILTQQFNVYSLNIISWTNELLIKMLQDGFNANVIQIGLQSPLQTKYFLIQSNSFPPLDNILIYSTSNTTSRIEKRYLSVICNNYLSLSTDSNDEECPATEYTDNNIEYYWNGYAFERMF